MALLIPQSWFLARLITLLIAGAALCAPAAGHATQPLQLDDHRLPAPIAPAAVYLIDESDSLSASQVAARPAQDFTGFEPGTEIIDLGMVTGALWMKLSLTNSGDFADHYYLDFNWPLISEIYVYDAAVAGHPELGRTGNAFAVADRPFAARTPVIPLHMQAGETRSLLIKVRTWTAMSLPARVHSPESFLSNALRRDAVVYAFFGLYVAFMLYHLIGFVSNREVFYLAFVAMTCARLFYDAYMSGFGQLLTPDSPQWNIFSISYIGGFASATGVWFHVEFLGLREKSPRIARAMLLYALAMVVLPHLALIGMPDAVIANLPLHLALPFVILASSIAMAHRGDRSAKIYLAGVTLTLLSVHWSTASMFGLYPAVYDMSLWSAMGYSMSFLVFAFSNSKKLEELQVKQQAALLELNTAQARADTKSKFLANMSHEIRTPLNGITGMLELLRGSPLTREQQRWTDIMESSSATLLTIVNDILDFSKIEAGKLSIEAMPCRPADLARECFEMMQHTCHNPNVTMTCEIDDSLPEQIISDPTRLRQIILNLLNNACKFTESGEIRLRVTYTHATASIRFAVHDTGIGVPAHRQSALFDAFEQSDADTYRKYGGTGLGLSICRELATLQGGCLDFTSEEGKGSSFWLDIPARTAEASTSKTRAEPLSHSGLTRALHVLVAEDNQVNQMVVKAMLEKLSCSCDVVGNGQDAVDAAASPQRPYDLILMDCDMPVRDGYSATAEIRRMEQQSKLARTPVVALTAHALEEYREKSLASGMDDYLTKPLSLHDLKATLQRSIDAAPEASSA